MPVNLDRSPKLDVSIPYCETSYYRCIGWAGYHDAIATGIIRARPGGKYHHAYYERGHANSIYARNGGGDVIVEVMDIHASGRIIDVAGQYPHTRVGEEMMLHEVVFWVKCGCQTRGVYRQDYGSQLPGAH